RRVRRAGGPLAAPDAPGRPRGPAQAPLDPAHVPALAKAPRASRLPAERRLKRVLVTGGAGFIGSHLVQALVKRGDEVSIVDNFDPFYPERLKRRALHPQARLLESDIRDQDAMHRAFGELKPDVVVHLAALAGVRPSLERPAAYMDVNVRGTAAVLEAARKAGTRRFVLGSSSSVYGAHAQAPFRETARIDSPESPYAASKVGSEVLARTFTTCTAWRSPPSA